MLEELTTPIEPGMDPEAAAASLELARQRLVDSAKSVASTQRRMEAQVREFNVVHNFTLVPVEPSRMGDVR